MERINGREAVSVYAEYIAGKRELADVELGYVKKQLSSFVKWLANKAKLTIDEAKDRIKAIIIAEVRLLKQDDPYADFVWSRGDEVGDLEISITDAIDNDFEKSSNMAHFDEQEYWNHMDRIAERNVGKYPDEVWQASRELMEKICEYLNGIRFSGKLMTDPKVRKLLFKCNKRINELRFGKKPMLLNKHWKLCKNICNELLGNEKRYLIKEVEEQTEEEKIDAMDNAVYGYFDSNQLYK